MDSNRDQQKTMDRQPKNENPAPGDIYAMPGERIENVKNPEFAKRHWLSLLSGYLTQNPGIMKKQVTMDRACIILSGILVVSIIVNMVEASVQKLPPVIVSIPNDTHDTISVVTLNQPPKSNQVVMNWAVDAICSSLTISFADHEKQIEAAREYFSPAGYQGFLDAINEQLIPTIEDESLVVTTAPLHPPIISHYPTHAGDFMEVQIPVVVSFSQGNSRHDKSSFWLVTVRVVSASTSETYTGKKIISMTMETATGSD